MSGCGGKALDTAFVEHQVQVGHDECRIATNGLLNHLVGGRNVGTGWVMRVIVQARPEFGVVFEGDLDWISEEFTPAVQPSRFTEPLPAMVTPVDYLAHRRTRPGDDAQVTARAFVTWRDGQATPNSDPFDVRFAVGP